MSSCKIPNGSVHRCNMVQPCRCHTCQDVPCTGFLNRPVHAHSSFTLIFIIKIATCRIIQLYNEAGPPMHYHVLTWHDRMGLLTLHQGQIQLCHSCRVRGPALSFMRGQTDNIILPNFQGVLVNKARLQRVNMSSILFEYPQNAPDHSSNSEMCAKRADASKWDLNQEGCLCLCCFTFPVRLAHLTSPCACT